MSIKKYSFFFVVRTNAKMATIPFDPTIVLGNLVNPRKFDVLEQIGTRQTEIAAKQQELNSILAAKNSLDMTKQEIHSMGVAMDESLDEITEKMNIEIKATIKDYAETQIKNLPIIAKLKSGIANIADHVESPLDYNLSLLKKDLPISSNTIKMNSQYFTFSQNKQSSRATISDMKAFAGGEVSFFGEHISSKVSSAVQSQMTKQIQKHDTSGTLVITATCTHANASIFAPLVLDVDKAISCWNDYFPEDKLNPRSKSKMCQVVMQNEDNNNSMHLVSGATYGSCFVGT